MREIKFRAWDGKRMLKHVYFFTTPHGFVWDANSCKVGVEAVMQFTGVKDTEGVDIYEGDIVTEGYNNKYGTFVVKWDTYGFNLNTGGDGSFKIIGNIYEQTENIKRQ